MFIREQVYHDLFNLGALFFLVILNLGNWTLSNYQFMWTGTYFETVQNCFFIYFSADTIWIYLYPKSVKSPWVIYIHHIFSLVGLSLVPLDIEIGDGTRTDVSTGADVASEADTGTRKATCR